MWINDRTEPDLYLADYGEPLGEFEPCEAQHTIGFFCTLPAGHAHAHAAGNSEYIVAIWNSEPNEGEE